MFSLLQFLWSSTVKIPFKISIDFCLKKKNNNENTMEYICSILAYEVLSKSNNMADLAPFQQRLKHSHCLMRSINQPMHEVTNLHLISQYAFIAVCSAHKTITIAAAVASRKRDPSPVDFGIMWQIYRKLPARWMTLNTWEFAGRFAELFLCLEFVNYLIMLSGL